MNRIYRAALVTALAGLVWATCGLAQTADKAKTPPNMVIEVRVEGNKVLSESAVLADAKIRTGQPYDDAVVREDEQRMLKTRRYNNVVATKTQTDQGVIVTFKVEERPVIEAVIFEGNKGLRVHQSWPGRCPSAAAIRSTSSRSKAGSARYATNTARQDITSSRSSSTRPLSAMPEKWSMKSSKARRSQSARYALKGPRRSGQ